MTQVRNNAAAAGACSLFCTPAGGDSSAEEVGGDDSMRESGRSVQQRAMGTCYAWEGACAS